MTTKADFNAEEWEHVLQGPPAAGLLVILAHRGGTLRESMSIARAYQDARRPAGPNALLDEIVAAQPPVRATPSRSHEEMRERCLGQLAHAVQTVRDRTDPQEREEYGAFVAGLAEGVAEAAKEGGFLGIGGERVSDAERAALDEIGRVLEGLHAA